MFKTMFKTGCIKQGVMNLTTLIECGYPWVSEMCESVLHSKKAFCFSQRAISHQIYQFCTPLHQGWPRKTHDARTSETMKNASILTGVQDGNACLWKGIRGPLGEGGITSPSG